jgi:O-succinylbenzoic acid--CoA ligase
MTGMRGRAVEWRAEASPESVAQLRRLRDAGAVIVPTRPGDPPSAPIQADLPAGSVVIRTSGSTGRPRRIVLPSDAFEASTRAAAGRLGLGTDDVWWACLSPAHVGGLSLILRADRLGSGLELTGGFDADTFWALCAGERITHASMVPTMLRRVLEARPPGRRPSSLRAVLVGGAAADPDLLRRAIDAGIPVATTWGMTETASQVATATPVETASDPTHAGRPLEGVGVRSGEGGRLEVNTPTMALGELVEGEMRPLADASGWFATDDLGHVDADGFVRITGRASDRIVSGGSNVDPLEVEREIRTLTWVEDVAVVGVPDPEWGERVVAVAVVRGDERRDTADLLDALPAGLAGARRPKTLVRTDALPRTASGKVDRGALRSMLRGRPL